MGDTSEQDAAKIAAAELAASETVEGDNDEVVIIDPSPTNFNPSMMPKTTESSVFRAVTTQAHADRSRICKFLAKMDSKVEELN